MISTLVFQVEQRKRTGMPGGWWGGGGDVALVELLQAGDAQKAHHLLHLLLQKLDHALDAGGAGGGQASNRAAHADPVGAQADRLDDAAAAAERAVDRDLGAGPATAAITSGRTAADPRPWSSWRPPWLSSRRPTRRAGRRSGVPTGADALQHELHVGELVLHPLEISPHENAAWWSWPGRGAPRLHEALGDVALTPRIDLGVDGDAEGVVARIHACFTRSATHASSPRT